MIRALQLFFGGAVLLMAAEAYSGPAIVLNEYQYDPSNTAAGDANQDTVIDTSEDEFIEYVNTGGTPIDLSGWSIYDAVALRHTFPVGTVLDAGCAIVVFGGGSPPPNLFAGAQVQTASTGFLGLNNNGDTIELRNLSNQPVVTHTYGSADVNQSYTRDPDLTGPFVLHTAAAGSNGALFSPGRRVDGTSFGACVPPGPDADGDGHPDDTDNCVNIANPDQTDCDNDGVGDVCTIAKTPRLDCNNNGVLDFCEPDCNGTGFPDDCDVIFGISFDCNGNLVPDECEVDCNSNFVPDDCDIASGTSLDANGNGIPDECESQATMVINEIHADPDDIEGDANNDTQVSATNDEFVEIVNAGTTAIDLSGWTLHDQVSVRHVFPPGTSVPADCSVVVFGGGSPIGQFGGSTVQLASSGTLGLTNGGDTVTIRDAGGLLVDEVVYGGNGGMNQSLTRSPDITGNFVLHTTANPNALFSPGRTVNLANFGGCPPTLPDADDDGIPDESDNCPSHQNPLQQDCDRDGIGDVCETDPDNNGNGVPDNCETGIPGTVKISEVRIDQPSADNDEYFEIKGPPGLSITTLTLIVIGDGTGGSGVIESVTPLIGQSIPSDGHFLVAEPTFSLAPLTAVNLVVANDALNFENSDNVTFVLVANFTGALNQDLDTNNDGTLDIMPWTQVVDAIGLIEEPNPPVNTEFSYGASLGFIDLGPDNGFVPGHAYRCDTTGQWFIGLFDPFAAGAADTPGDANPACEPPPCPGDRDGNGFVDVSDLLIVINTWGTGNPMGDANGDGAVNVSDLLIVINEWGACP